jgi:hypothetical protein
MSAADSEVLTALRSDMLRGDFSGLDSHLAALSDLESRVAERQDADALAALRAEAERNRQILASAAAGVRAALRRLGEATEPPSIYGSDGRRRTIVGTEPANESRA